MTPFPVIVGFGGINAAGRVSFHHAYRRTVIQALDEPDVSPVFKGLATLMGVQGDSSDCGHRQFMLENTLIRKIDAFDVASVGCHRSATLVVPKDTDLTIHLSARQLPDRVPDGWNVQPESRNRYRVTVKAGTTTKIMLPDSTVSKATAGGQIPKGFNPSMVYPSRSHPRGLELAIIGASDAVQSLGLDWQKLMDRVGPDGLAVFAGSAMGQVDQSSIAGAVMAPWIGKRPTSKQVAFSLSEMAADFVNAYVVGNFGVTTGGIGACATFLYNLRLAAMEIQSGRRRIAIAGGSEAPITPELVESYRTMGAIADDAQLAALDGADVADLRRACRPFSENAGFTVAEGSSYMVLMDDTLALELGANMYGSIGGVFVNADGYKKSISGPGVGNYLTMGKAIGRARAIVGEEGVRSRSFVHAHGTGTPQNRVTESHILNEIAKAFGIERWPVAAVKAFLGHTMAAASGDQATSALGTWRYGVIPGIATIDHVADDVYRSHLDISPEHKHVDPCRMDTAIVNSKGFGGNNASGVLLSPDVTERLIKGRHGSSSLNRWRHSNESIQAAADQYDEKCVGSGFVPTYRFGVGVLSPEQVAVSDRAIALEGHTRSVSLESENPFLPPDVT